MSGPVDVLAVSAEDIAAMQAALSNVARAPRDMAVRRMEAAAFVLSDRIRERIRQRDVAVAELIGTLRLSAEALEKASACVDGGLAVLLADRATFARDAITRVGGAS